MKKQFVLFAFLLMAVAGYGQVLSVSGKLTGTGSEYGLTGANISLINTAGNQSVYNGVSGRNGSFIIENLPSGSYILEASYLGYQSGKLEIELKEKNLSGLLLNLDYYSIEVGEVTVSSTRQDRMLRDVSLPLAVVNRGNIDHIPAVTPAGLFDDTPGVTLARDGIWATSINIRGLTEQRIVALVDGNRIETATDIAGGLAMIDVNDIERIEVIKGAASSLYGTGALGGVVNIITRDGHYNDDFYVGGSLSGSFHSVNSLNTEHASIEAGDQKWYTRISGTLRDASNTMTPKGELLNSQFTDNNLSVKLGVKPFKNHELSMNYQRFDASDVGIPGGSAFPGPATAIYPEELRNMFSTTYKISRPSGSLNTIKFKYFHQYILRDVELKPSGLVTITPSGYHTTNGAQMQTDWTLGEHHQLIAGLDLWQRFLSTEREKKVISNVTDSLGNVISSSTIVRGEVPIPDAKFTSAGIFVQDQFSIIDNRLTFTIGGRFDLINTVNDQAVDPLYIIANGTKNLSPPNQRISFEANNLNNSSWGIDAGALYHLFPNTDITFTASRAFRAPSLEERFKYIDLGSKVKIGDPKLKPEKGYFIDLGGRVWRDKLQFTGNVFANSMTDLIVEMPGIFIYNYSANPANYDTLSASINSNIDKALLYGFDAGTEVSFFEGFSFKAIAGFVRGKNTTTDTNLPQIPPFNGRVSLKYRLAGWFTTEISSNIADGQNKIAIGETKSQKYSTYDFGIYSVPFKFYKFNVEAFGGVQNITDKAYMNHLATNRGLVKYEPGRNFFLKIRISF